MRFFHVRFFPLRFFPVRLFPVRFFPVRFFPRTKIIETHKKGRNLGTGQLGVIPKWRSSGRA